MACQQISRRPCVAVAVEKWPKTKSRHPRSQAHVQAARVGVPEPPIVLAKAKLRVVAYVESFTPLPRSEASSFRGRWGAEGPRVGVRRPRRREPVALGPSEQASSRYPGTIAPAEPDRAENGGKSLRRISAAAHSIAAIRCSSAEFPIPRLPPLSLTDLRCAPEVAPGL